MSRIYVLSFKIIIVGSAVILLFYSCASVPKFTSEKWNNNIKQDTITYENPAGEKTVLESIVGLASYYAEPFHGRQTSNGEVYDKNGLTAAHSSYPFGTIIKVTNLSNNKSVEIRINDRMPKHPARVIDLSYGTAKALDMVEKGVTKVRLDILEWGTKE
ncbi:MAG: septal ring lytic transglycosylase RlpA family protein [Melioribacteraceae bacterium]|nr:septal ring lytic transglycosylase RlpA family protein [Melioribacteraceae bacterium]